MTEIIRRVLIAALLVLVMLVLHLRLMATFEPMSRGIQITWRLAYGCQIAACLFGIVRQARPRRPKG